jgi:tetratricopeptide (TPR) repeat protein
MHAALGRLNDELERRWATRLEVRTGVATGEVLAGGRGAVLGSPANLAARLQAAAGDGEILLAADTQRLVRDDVLVAPAGVFELKGFDGPVQGFRLLDLGDGSRLRTRTPHVGREQELSLLDLAYRRAIRDRRAQLATVLGDPGMGKTRLVDEAVGRLGDEPLVLRGRCQPYGEGITFSPVAEAVTSAAGIERDDDVETATAKIAALVPDDSASVADRLAEAIGLGGTAGAPEETLWAIRRFFELLAAERALVLIFDDLQWGEPTFLDLVTQLGERGQSVPELIIAIARPELVERRPEWAGGTANALTISLEPLVEGEGIELARHVTAGAQLDERLAARIVAIAGGNPLFLEEYAAMLMEDGILSEHDGRWQAPGDLTTAATPPTLIGLLTARLHRLPPAEREALVNASVIGKGFSIDELAVLAPSVASGIDETVRRMLDRGLVRTRPGTTDGTFEFQHPLLRDAAYASLPKARRAELHESFAAYLGAAETDRTDELDELVGFHLAQAHDYRTELGARDEATRSLGASAATRLSAAGGRAVERGDPHAAIRLLRRAISMATAPGPRAAMRLRLCHALGDTADAERYEATLEAGLADATASGDDRLRTRFEHLRTTFALVSQTKATSLDDVDAQLRSQIEVLRSFRDTQGVAEGLYQLATTAWIRGDAAGFERSARDALGTATASGDARLVGRAATYVILALLRGPTPLPTALDELRAIRSATTLSNSASASLRLIEAEMLTYLDRPDEAHALVETAASELTELGLSIDVAAADSVRSIVADAIGDLEEAERSLRRSYERFRAAGDSANGGVVAVDLADVLVRSGRHAEAEELATVAAELAADADVEAQVGWRMASARARAALGDPDDAIRLVEEATARLGTTDFTVLRANAFAATGDVLATIGRTDEARDRSRAALQIYAAKGHAVGERRMRRRLAAITPRSDGRR